MSNIIPHAIPQALALKAVQEVANLGSNICSNILQYRVETAKIEFAREQMYQQADIELVRIQADLDEEITKVQTLGNAFEMLVNANPNDGDNILKAFLALNDTLRSQPRVFTDVSYNKKGD